MRAAITLPATLNRQFDLLEHRLRHIDTRVAVSGGLGSLLLSYTLQFASDRLWDTPHWLRFLFALCGWTGFAVFAWRYGTRWTWGRPSIRALAVIVQQRYRWLGDRLLGIVELADPKARPSNYSPELCAAAIQQVAGEASSFDFQQAAGEPGTRRYVASFLALGAIVTLLAVGAPDAARNAALRWFWPVSNIERYTFVTLDALPDHLVVAQGEPFEISVGVSPHSFWRPQSIRSHFEGQPGSYAAIRGGVAAFHLPGQTQPRVLWISAGDVAHPISIEPAVRPDLREIRARLDLPAYLKYPPQEQRIEAGGLTFLPGTYAKFTGVIVRDLASATLQGEKPVALGVNGARFSTGPILLELERNLAFIWRDTLGLAGPGPQIIHAMPREDAPPAIQLRGLAAASAMLPEETAQIDLASTDDYGVRRVMLAWQNAAPSPAEPQGPLHQILLAEGQPQAKTLGGHYDFSPALLQIQADTTVLVRGLAIDYYPYRQPSSSPIYRIHVLSREAHARLIHDEFEKLLEQLEELTRRQETILQSGKAVRSQPEKNLANEESAQKLGEQSTGQKQNASQLKNLAKQTADTLAEALRNPQISPDTLKDWANHAEQMSQLAAHTMPAAARALDSSKSDPSQRPQRLDQALNQEQDILNAMRQMEKQGSKDLESLMAQTLAARLRRAAGTERDIAGTFQKMLPDTIGMTTEQLPADGHQELDTMSARHAEVARETDRLQDEISRLYDRTSLNRYGDVAHEMDTWKTGDAMAALGGLVANNQGAHSIDNARYWGDQFERWAQRLAEKDDSKTNSSSSGGGNSAAQMQALLALMRLRQQQDQLREQTSVLEEQKQTNEDYPQAARDAEHQQSSLHDQLQAMQEGMPPNQLTPAGKAMSDAAGLLAKPETGHPTHAAQTDALNLLDEAIADQAQKAGANASALMAMMGMGMGASGGGNTGGGATGKPNVPIPGSREGKAPDQRAVIQAGGIDNSQLPGEFRDAIEGYHRAIEQSPQP